MSYVIFVYGSLMKGFGNHALLEKSEYLGHAVTEKKFEMLDLGAFPAVVDEGKTAIFGELYRVNKETLGHLDHLEGHPNFYRRTPIVVFSGRALTTVPAEFYLWRRPRTGLPRTHTTVRSGDWRKRK